MVTPPVHKNEQTGNPVLDRIQDNVRGVVQVLTKLIAAITKAQPISLMLKSDWSTTLATPQPTPLTFPVKAGDIWDVDYFGLDACSSTNGMGHAIGAPPNSTVSGVLYSSSANTAAANWILIAITSPNAFIGACHVGASNAGRPTHLNVRVKAGADGAITLKACSVTAGTTTGIAAKAYLRAMRVTEV